MIDGKPLLDRELKCECCERVCQSPSFPKFLESQMGEGNVPYMCKTCWAIWYDGQTEIEKIKHYSLMWPVDYIGATATDDTVRIKEIMDILNKVKS